MKNFIYILCAIVFVSSPASSEPSESFDDWKASFKGKATSIGVPGEWVDSYVGGVTPIKRVIELDGKQPEGEISFEEYKDRVVTNDRVKRGKILLRQNYLKLKEIEALYGVPAEVVVALWGIETSYGQNTGGFQVIPALASLAWDGRRREFFENELIYAMTIVADGHIPYEHMMGSWAGAMGQNQFMPSSFMKYAVDHNGDGRRDIWKTNADIFASTSNYLKKNGWEKGGVWGRSVYIPEPLPKELVGYKIRKPLSFWKERGVQSFLDDLPGKPSTLTSIIQPDGEAGATYIVYNNYQTIMDWNRSTYFATSVGLLADLIAKE